MIDPRMVDDSKPQGALLVAFEPRDTQINVVIYGYRLNRSDVVIEAFRLLANNPVSVTDMHARKTWPPSNRCELMVMDDLDWHSAACGVDITSTLWRVLK
jgi:hypothetical protein